MKLTNYNTRFRNGRFRWTSGLSSSSTELLACHLYYYYFESGTLHVCSNPVLTDLYLHFSCERSAVFFGLSIVLKVVDISTMNQSITF